MFINLCAFIAYPSCSSRLIILPNEWSFTKGNDGLWHGQIKVPWNERIDEALHSEDNHFSGYANRFLNCLFEVDKSLTIAKTILLIKN